MNSNAQLISDLALAKDTHQVLELMVTYKGLPVIAKCRVSVINLDEVVLVTQDPGLICLEKGKKITILGSDYFEPATATILHSDIKTGSIVLSNFTYLGTRLGERMIVRVEPKEPILVKIDFENQQLEGVIADLSLNGIGIRIDRQKYNPALKPGVNVQLGFELPNDRINLVGTVLSAVKQTTSHRLSVRFTQSEAHKVTIFHYLVDRRSQIEHELLAEYEGALVSP